MSLSLAHLRPTKKEKPCPFRLSELFEPSEPSEPSERQLSARKEGK